MISSLYLMALVPFFVNAKVHHVSVGKGGLVFDPPAFSAEIGDQVVYTFFAKNHSLVETSFGSVCSKKEGGINSGFQPVAANTTEGGFPTFTVDVKTKEPLWFYCSQAAGLPASHCGQGMVQAVNCPFEGPNSFDNFKAAAIEVGKKLVAQGGAPTASATAAYGGYTIPPEPAIVVVTQPVTVGSSSWTTTYSSYPGSPAPTPESLEGKVHTVTVGGPSGLIFDPPRIDAKPRDKVVFTFLQKNHSLVQSSFADPCRKLENGFASGFQPFTEGTELKFELLVNDTNPIWAYCSQKTPASHCGSGMVFSINSVESGERNFKAFQDLAKVMNGTAVGSTSQPTDTPGGNGASGVAVSMTSLLAVVGAALLGMSV